MTYSQKLKKIRFITKKTQVELAGLFGVSFQTFNSWLHEKSIPRAKAQEKIDLIYQEYTGVSEIDNSALQEKKERIFELQKRFPNPLKTLLQRKDLYETFLLELTYHTNSIEGSTFNEPQVRAVLFDNALIPDKTIIEHQEVKNHQAVFGTVMQQLHNGKITITEENIKKLHSILMNGILQNAGQYRNHSVRITGSKTPTANYMKVPELIRDFVKQLKTSVSNKELFNFLAKIHAHFEQIHPFSDGNGRVGRLLMQMIALQYGFPPIIVRQEKKYAYYEYLERAQMKEEYIFLESFLCDGLLEAYKIFDI